MMAKFLQKNGRSFMQRSGVPVSRVLPRAFRVGCVVLLLLTVPFANAAKVEDFIPQESVLYVKLQDIDEVYSEIETSKSWEKALALLPNTPDWQEMQQGVSMVQGFLGTDLLSVLETVGYRTAFAVWVNEENTPEMGVVVHSGGNRSELQRFTKIAEGLIGMSNTNTFHVDAGKYQRVPYNMMEVDQQVIVKYGFVGDFLVLGVGERAFEDLIDTFRKKAPSIAKNRRYAEIAKQLDSGQISLFCNVQQTLKDFPRDKSIPIEKNREDPNNFAELRALFDELKFCEVMLGELNLLENGEFLTLYAQFTQKAIERYHRFVPSSKHLSKENRAFKTIRAVSTDADMFLAISPIVSEVVWQLISTFIDEGATDDVYAAISFLEGLLNLNLEEDIFPSLTGEIAIVVNDLRQFDPSALEGMEAEVDGAFFLDASGMDTQGTLIFNASHPLKWNQLSNSISNLQNVSRSQTEYKGVPVSTFATNFHYSEVDGLFLFGASEEQMYALIDEIKNKKSPASLRQLPKTTLAVAQLNVARALEMEKGAPPPNRVLVNSDAVPPVLAWLSVKESETRLKMTLSRRGTGLEALAKLIPFFVWNMEQR